MLSARVFAFTLLLSAMLVSRAMGAVVTHLESGRLSADVMFEVSGADLIITLSNVSAADVVRPDDVLTGLFFNSRVALDLTPVSARLADGSTLLFSPSPAGGNIGGEWAYGRFTPAEFDYAYGIGASGLNLFGAHNRFDVTQNLGGPASMAGIDFGLVSAADDPATGNHPVTGKTPLIKHAAVFTLTGLPEGFDPTSDLLGLRVEYGSATASPFMSTAPGEPVEFANVIPAPSGFWAGLVLLTIGCVAPRLCRRL